MTVWEEREDETQKPETVVRSFKRRMLLEWLALGALLLGAVWFLTSCAPTSRNERSLTVDWPKPETGLNTIPAALTATDDKLVVIGKNTMAIKNKVAELVPPVREAAKAAPAPAAAIAKGHETIFAAASNAEAAALEAQAQVRVANAGASQADADLKALREAHQREVEALGQQVDTLEQELARLQEESASFLQKIAKGGMIVAGLAIAGGVGLFFLRMGIAIPLSVIGFGVTLLALSALLQRIAGWVVPVAGGAAVLTVVGAVAYGLHHWRKTAVAGISVADAVKAGVRDAVKNEGAAASRVEEALKKVKNESILNQPEDVQREVWNLRPFKQA